MWQTLLWWFCFVRSGHHARVYPPMLPLWKDGSDAAIPWYCRPPRRGLVPNLLETRTEGENTLLRQ